MKQLPPERHDYEVQEIRAVYELPLFELVDRARDVHRAVHAPNEIQLCSLLSVKTGACPEDCGYCAQSARYATGLEPERLVDPALVVEHAKAARSRGATRFCMGAAWRGLRDDSAFDRVLEMVRSVKELGLECCCSMGMLTAEQARRLKEAGLDAYNHNLDTSPRFYKSIVTTRTYEERMQTLRLVQQAGIQVCTGGIIGLGESVEDRCAMLRELSSLDPHPDSVPINLLIRMPGTPLEKLPPVDPLDALRMAATARILMPRSIVRLSAGRSMLTPRGPVAVHVRRSQQHLLWGQAADSTERRPG